MDTLTQPQTFHNAEHACNKDIYSNNMVYRIQFNTGTNDTLRVCMCPPGAGPESPDARGSTDGGGREGASTQCAYP